MFTSVKEDKGKGTNTEVCEGTSPLREITGHHPAVVTFLSLPQPKLVLVLVTPEGCKAESILVVVVSQDSLSAKEGRLSQK